MIKASTTSIYRWTLCCGPGTNTRAELLGAWATLLLASRLNIDRLHLIGDSKLIINWLNQKGNLHTITLLAWIDRIRLLKCHFKELFFSHISREYNMEADFLSKSALQRKAGILYFSHWLSEDRLGFRL
jgi:ribonuclease HI